MSDLSKPSQQFVQIKEIKDGVVYLKGGGMRKTLIVSGINFDLKSEAEQNLILNSFQNFLNTIDFSVQFFIHSRKANISAYLEKVRRRLEEEKNELLKIQIQEYANFIKSFVEENAIINKEFFVVVPYSPVSVAQTSGGIMDIFFKRSAAVAQKNKEDANREAMEQLDHRVEQVISGLEQIGLRAAPLADEELIELFYNLYNPQFLEKKNLEIVK